MWPTFFIPAVLAAAGGPFVNQTSEICGNSITFDLDVDMPGIKAGDYVVYFVRINNGTGNSSSTVHDQMILQPSEVECLWQEPRYNNHKQSYSSQMTNSIWANVYGEFITDTTATRTFTRNSTEYGLCGFAFAYRGVNRKRPVTYMESLTGDVSSSGLPYAGVIINRGFAHPAVKTNSADVAWLFRMVSAQRTTGVAFSSSPGTYTGDRSINGTEYTAQSAINSAAAVYAAWKAWHEEAPLADMPVNLLPWDTVTNGGSGTEGIYATGWTLSGVTLSDTVVGSEQLQRIYGNGAAGAHNMYVDVTLTEGETYFYSAIINHSDAPNAGCALVIENPSAVEEGFSFVTGGFPGLTLRSQIGTHSHVPFMIAPDSDGIPSSITGLVGMAYTAGATGTHRIKFALTDTSGNLSWTAPGTAFMTIMQLQLTQGRLGVGGPDGVSPGWRNWISAGVDACDVRGEYCSFAFSFNKDTDSFAEAKMEAHWPEATPEATAYPEWTNATTKLATNNDEILGAVGQFADRVVADHWVFPTYRTTPEGSPVTGKYYAEITVGTKGTCNPIFWVLHTSSKKRQTEDSNDGQATGYASNATTYVPQGCSASATPATFTTSDVIGIAIDYSLERTTFYKNGVEQFYVTWPAAWQDAGGMPMRIAADIERNGTPVNFTFNMKGPFTYKPTGFVAYDVFNDAS